MTEIEINETNKKFYLPENWNEVKLGTFIEYYKLSLRKDDIDGLEYITLLLSILMNVDKVEIEDLYIDDMKAIASELKWLDVMPLNSEKTIFDIVNESGEVVKYILKDNIKMKAKEQITLEHILKDEKDNTLSFPLVLAVLLRPAIEYKDNETGKISYHQQELDTDFSTIVRRAEIFTKALTIDDVYGPLVFFSNGGKKHSTKTSERTSSLKITRTENSPSFLQQKESQEATTNSETNGIGI